ncbi:MAG TPA: hypothetical protein PK385_12705 [Spirochaetota bacterium]|jgi:hypothetical protein|nr:hypothetical protein [Spirochaetota bacterium]
MRNESQPINELVEKQKALIKEIEAKLIHSAKYKVKTDVTEMDLMSETYKLLDITKPIEKYHNTNKNQNLY